MKTAKYHLIILNCTGKHIPPTEWGRVELSCQNPEEARYRRDQMRKAMASIDGTYSIDAVRVVNTTEEETL